MYRVRHTETGVEVDLTPSAIFDTLRDAIDEAHKRMRYPTTPKAGSITIDRTEDGKTLRVWVWNWEWKAEPPKGSTPV